MISALRRFWNLLDREDRKRTGFAMAMILINAVLDVAGLALLPLLVAVLSAPQFVAIKLVKLTGWHGFDSWSITQIVLRTTLFVSIFYLFKTLFTIWMLYRQGLFKAYLQGKLGHRLIRGYLNAPYAWHLHRSALSLQQTLQHEVPFLFHRIITPLFICLSEVITILFIAFLLIYAAPLPTLATILLTLAAGALYSSVFKAKLEALGRGETKNRSAVSRSIKDGLNGIKELKILGRTGYFETEYEEKMQQVARADQMHLFISSSVKTALEGLAVLSLACVLFVELLLRCDIELLLPNLALFAVAAVRLMPSINRILVAQGNMRFGLAGFDHLIDDLEAMKPFLTAAKASGASPPPAWAFSRTIEIANVNYRYPLAVKDCLSEVSLTIRKGDSVALVGPSGAGKTTLVDLILGLIQPTRGTICVDGKDIHESLPEWCRQIGYIPQSIYLGDGTLRANVAFGVHPGEIDNERVWSALWAAQLGDLVESWPEKLDKQIGEMGVRLSGGQRQRIGIARALYHDPAILILDEATAALDNETEREIVSVLERFRGERTLITIAHRLTTVEKCDCLFFLEEGRVIASGSYPRLKTECASFARLINAVQSDGIVT